MLWFRPIKFFTIRFLSIDSSRLRIIGFIGTALGLFLGGIFTYLFTNYVLHAFSLHPEEYAQAIKNLNLDKNAFFEMLKLQKAYSLVLAVLSVVIAYMAPHIFGGAIFAFLWLLVRNSETKLDFMRILDCVSVALGSMIYYAIPVFGPVIAMFMVGINLSRALFIDQKLIGFMKIMGIIMAMYFCFFVSAASLQLLAVPVAAWLQTANS
jgi:hypothetical protein